jgi:hypothetical protein
MGLNPLLATMFKLLTVAEHEFILLQYSITFLYHCCSHSILALPVRHSVIW